MHSLARRRRSVDIWPGFVDALSSLILVMVFMLLMFAIGQFVLSDAISGKDRALAALHTEISQLAKTLSLSQAENARLNTQAEQLSASLSLLGSERDTLTARLSVVGAELSGAIMTVGQRDQSIVELGNDIGALQALKAELEAEVARLVGALDTAQHDIVVQTELSTKATAQVELLNRQLAALRDQLSQIAAALDIANSKVKERDVKLASLGQELNLALANKVGELSQYRSDFFGRLKEALGNRADLLVVGDRFVVPAELLFASGSADLGPAAQAQLTRLAQTLNEVAAEIPSTLDWVLRIDGHTDRRPIATARFPSNWELSTARAVAIVKHLVVQGIPAKRLAANGFGEFRPIDEADNEAAYTRNRRIEIQLTNR